MGSHMDLITPVTILIIVLISVAKVTLVERPVAEP